MLDSSGSAESSLNMLYNKSNLKGSDDGVKHSESMVQWLRLRLYNLSNKAGVSLP
jgi:hypothetical protein